MSETNSPQQDQDNAGSYEIRVRGHLDDRWKPWFGGLTLTPEENGDTLISGKELDQAALFGLLRKVRDAGMLLVSVNRVTARLPDACGDPSKLEPFNRS